jgi:hypothetical protein
VKSLEVALFQLTARNEDDLSTGICGVYVYYGAHLAHTLPSHMGWTTEPSCFLTLASSICSYCWKGQNFAVFCLTEFGTPSGGQRLQKLFRNLMLI